MQKIEIGKPFTEIPINIKRYYSHQSDTWFTNGEFHKYFIATDYSIIQNVDCIEVEYKTNKKYKYAIPLTELDRLGIIYNEPNLEVEVWN